jgi:hypothetical protein
MQFKGFFDGGQRGTWTPDSIGQVPLESPSHSKQTTAIVRIAEIASRVCDAIATVTPPNAATGGGR